MPSVSSAISRRKRGRIGAPGGLRQCERDAGAVWAGWRLRLGVQGVCCGWRSRLVSAADHSSVHTPPGQSARLEMRESKIDMSSR